MSILAMGRRLKGRLVIILYWSGHPQKFGYIFTRMKCYSIMRIQREVLELAVFAVLWVVVKLVMLNKEVIRWKLMLSMR